MLSLVLGSLQSICLPSSDGLLLLPLDSRSCGSYCLPVLVGKQMLFKATAALQQKNVNLLLQFFRGDKAAGVLWR